jgi:hypothetical protein
MVALLRGVGQEMTVVGRHVASSAADIRPTVSGAARQVCVVLAPAARRLVGITAAGIHALQERLESRRTRPAARAPRRRRVRFRDTVMLTGVEGSVVPVPRIRPRDRVLAAVKLVMLVATVAAGIAGGIVAAAVRIAHLGG